MYPVKSEHSFDMGGIALPKTFEGPSLMNRYNPNVSNIWTRQKKTQRREKFVGSRKFLNESSQEQSLMPVYNSVTDVPHEVKYARERYQPEKVKIHMIKGERSQNKLQFGLDIGLSEKYGNNSSLSSKKMLKPIKKNQKSKFRSVSKLETSDFKSMRLGSIAEMEKSYIELDSNKQLTNESINNLPVLVGIHDFNNSGQGTGQQGVQTDNDTRGRSQLAPNMNPQADA